MIEYLKSAAEFTSIIYEAGKLCVQDAVAWADTKLADRINGPEDE